jgi:hypothetical protein
LIGIPSKVNAALKSSLAKNILGKWGDKISGFIGNFTSRIKQLLNKVTGKTGKKTTKEIGGSTTDVVKSDTFQKMLSTDRTLGKYGLVDSSQGLANSLKKVVFDPSKVKVPYKTTHSGGQQAIQVLGPNNTSLVFYKSRSQGWIPISGYKNKKAIPMNIESKYVSDFVKFLQKNGVEGLSKSVVKQTAKTTAKSTLTKITKTSLTNFFRIMPKISKGSFVLRKLGFVVGKPYKYVGKSGKAMTATIKEITDNGVKVAFKNGTTTMIPVETFIKNAVGAPWMRRGYSVTVPLFIKRFSDFILPNGNIDYTKIEQLPDLDPNTTSQESMEYLQEEVASYEGDKGNYSVNTNVSTIQNALIKLGFKLPKFGADGKFGPETQEVLKQFQGQNKLTSSSGKIDRLTARKLSELLKSKNIPDSDQLITSLNDI